MVKKQSGPFAGPDHEAGPLEIAPSDTATSQISNSDGFAQRGEDAPPAVSAPCYPLHDADFPPGSVVYDTGWEGHSRLEVRTVFTSGPPSDALRQWVRAQMVSSVPLSDDDEEMEPGQ